MKFKVKDMDISTGGIKIVLVNQKDAKKLDLHHEDRLGLTKDGKKITCIVDIGESKKAVPEGSLGLFEEALAPLNAKRGDTVEISFEKKPESVHYIKKKLDGKKLDTKEMNCIVQDIVDGKLSAIEITYFVAAGYTRGFDANETADLTMAMVNTGEILKIDGNNHPAQKIFDKHCIGGVAGNRTTMLVVPIVCAAGLIMPKTSSRSITSPAGTADTMEVLAKVGHPISKVKEIVEKTGGCIVWGGALNLAPADDMIIKVENPLSVDAEGQMLASILAKKKSVSSTDVLIDIPYGKGAKTESIGDAKKLGTDFEKLGRRIGLQIKVIYTDGTRPIGNGIGPILEARDVLWILKNDIRGPKDLREKCLMMAGIILEMGGKAGRGKGKDIAKQLLESGKAYEKMKEIITAQGRAVTVPEETEKLLGKYRHELVAAAAGRITTIDNKIISKICRLAGCPDDKGAGVYLNKHVNDSVAVGEKLYMIYAESKDKLDFVREMLKTECGVRISTG